MTTVAPARGSVPRRAASAGRPVLVLTLGAPIATEAATVAVEAAADAGSALVLANITRMEPLSLSLLLGYDALEELTPETSASLRALAERARGAGIAVERLRVRTPRLVAAMLEVVGERSPGLVVFGPEPDSIRPRLYRRVVAALRDRVDTLLWLPGERTGSAWPFG